MKSENIVCCRCGEVVRNRKSFALSHAKKHSSSPVEQERIIIDSIYGKEKVDRLIKEYEEGKICIYQMHPTDITKYLCLIGKKRTSSEERKTERYKKKYLHSIQKKYGDSITNISQVKEVQDKKEYTISKSHGSYSNYLSKCRDKMVAGYSKFCEDSDKKKQRQDKIVKTCQRRYGVCNPSMIEQARKNISLKAKKRMAILSSNERSLVTKSARKSIPHHWATTTKLEQIVIDGLNKLGIDCILHKRVGRYSIDIVVGSVAIEVNGDVFHSNPRIYKPNDNVLKGLIASSIWERDNRKRKAIEEAGYTVIVLWEDEIRRNKNTIETFIKSKLPMDCMKQED